MASTEKELGLRREEITVAEQKLGQAAQTDVEHNIELKVKSVHNIVGICSIFVPFLCISGNKVRSSTGRSCWTCAPRRRLEDRSAWNTYRISHARRDDIVNSM